MVLQKGTLRDVADHLYFPCTPPQMGEPFPEVDTKASPPLPSFVVLGEEWRVGPGVRPDPRSLDYTSGFQGQCISKNHSFSGLEGTHTPSNIDIPSATPLACGCPVLTHIPPRTGTLLFLEAATPVSGLLLEYFSGWKCDGVPLTCPLGCLRA